jgi:hypothetical protein
MLLAAAGCSTTPPGIPAGTQVVEVKLLGADQRIAAGWDVTADPGTGPLDYCVPSPYALEANIQSCGSSADGASVCWAPPGQNNLYCGTDPWEKTVRKLYAAQTLSESPAPIDPEPWGMELVDGSRCVARTGGAWPVNSDGTVVIYICGENDPTPYVLAQPEERTVDKSGPIWTVLGGALEVEDPQAMPPKRVGLQAVYYAA